MRALGRPVRWPRVVATLASVPASVLLVLGVGVFLVYYLWPAQVVGVSFPELSGQLPDRGEFQGRVFRDWIVVTGLASIAGMTVITVSARSTSASAFSRRRILEGCSLALGLTASHIWAPTLNVGHWMDRLFPEAKFPTFAYPWYFEIAGLLALAAFIGMKIYGHQFSEEASGRGI